MNLEKIGLIHEILEKNLAYAEDSPLREKITEASLADFYKNKKILAESEISNPFV